MLTPKLQHRRYEFTNYIKERTHFKQMFADFPYF